jgi:hypothetical protein
MNSDQTEGREDRQEAFPTNENIPPCRAQLIRRILRLLRFLFVKTLLPHPRAGSAIRGITLLFYSSLIPVLSAQGSSKIKKRTSVKRQISNHWKFVVHNDFS